MAIIPLICLIAAAKYAIHAHPLLADNLCAAPCGAQCSPQCLPRCCTGSALVAAPPASCAPSKPQFVVGSVEEGETEECADKGFQSPTDNSEDPPGTITIPLPPTMYTPPKPGEEAKELPLPDFKLPASLLEGKMPGKSMTLEPVTDNAVAAVPAASASGNAPAEPMVQISAPPVALSAKSPPPALPPPPAPAPAPVSTGPLQFPKLPPVTSSEIPGRANRLPPPPGKIPVKVAVAPQTSLLNFPKPPPIHLTVNSAAPNTNVLANPAIAGIASTTGVGSSTIGTQQDDPVASEMEKELNSRYG